MNVRLKMLGASLSLTALLAVTSCGGGTHSQAVVPQPDFSLTAAPASVTLTPGGNSQTVSISATPANSFAATVSVKISGLPSGVTAQPATFTLTPGTAQNVTLTAASSAAAGSVTFTFSGTSGALSHTATVAATISTTTPAPDFSLTLAPASLTLTAGATGSVVSVTANAINGFSSAVAVAITGLPSGVTANPATLSLTPGKAQNVTLTAASSATAGSVTLTFSGTSGALSHTATVAATISTTTPTPDFSLTLAPTSLTLTTGATSSAVSVTANAVNGFSSTVAVAITGLPSGVTANPATLSLTPGKAQNATLTAASSATAGSATPTFTGTSGDLSHTAKVALSVSTVAPTPNFSLTLAPTSLALTAGATGSAVSVTANAINGFSSTVAIAITGLPSGVTASPATLSLTSGRAQNVILTAASSATAGNATLTFTGTSGSLTHTAQATITVGAAPAPDFSLSVSPTSLALTAGATGASTSVSAKAANGFTSAVLVAITGLPSGVTANPTTHSLTPGAAQSITLTASSSAVATTATVTFTGTSGSLTHSAALALTVQLTTPTTSAPDVTTYHYDVARDGLNAQETILTPTNVNSSSFGKIGFDTVDGKVDAEPLYLANMSIGGSNHNVLYVATEHGSVYAFDADNSTQLWKTSLIESGETTSDDRNCNQIATEIGITSTPVIDRKQGAKGTIFAVTMSKDANGAYHQRLHALDLTTGAEISGSPTEVAATYPGSGTNSQNGNVTFDPGQYAERAALLLLNGNIYTAWTSHCDSYPYSGWVIAYSESTLKQSQVLNLTPNGDLGAIWMSGDGLAADSAGSIYFLDANGAFDTTLLNGYPAQGDYGNAMVKLNTQGSLTVADYFETYNTADETNGDQDLGSGGELLLPDQKDANGVTRSLIVGAGKDRNIYLADRTNLGKFNASTSPIDSNIYQLVTSALNGSVFSTPAYFNGVLYYAASGDTLRAFPLTNAKLANSASSQSAATFAFPGATPAVSANGTQNGIVWAVESGTGSAAVLHAYNAANLSNELYNSNQASGSRDGFGNGNKFITPLVVNGKVYVGTQTGVAIFGLL